VVPKCPRAERSPSAARRVRGCHVSCLKRQRHWEGSAEGTRHLPVRPATPRFARPRQTLGPYRPPHPPPRSLRSASRALALAGQSPAEAKAIVAERGPWKASKTGTGGSFASGAFPVSRVISCPPRRRNHMSHRSYRLQKASMIQNFVATGPHSRCLYSGAHDIKTLHFPRF